MSEVQKRNNHQCSGYENHACRQYIIMYAAAMDNAITAVFQCLSAISVNGFLMLFLRWFLLIAFRHTYTSNLLSGGAKPKDVQESLGHSDISTTMNIYAHSTREAKRTSARLLDKVMGEP